MATIELYVENSYLKECSANIVSIQDRFVVFNQTIFILAAVGSLVTGGSLNKVMKAIMY
ncbi:hypothetical protein PSKAS_25390 [Peribacillus sp. N1]